MSDGGSGDLIGDVVDESPHLLDAVHGTARQHAVRTQQHRRHQHHMSQKEKVHGSTMAGPFGVESPTKIW